MTAVISQSKPPCDFRRRSCGILMHVTSLPGPHGCGDLGPEAHRFIDFLMDSAVIADVTNTSKFANANRDAGAAVDPDVRNDPGVYPPAELRARLHLVPAESQAYARRRARMWTRCGCWRPFWRTGTTRPTTSGWSV